MHAISHSLSLLQPNSTPFKDVTAEIQNVGGNNRAHVVLLLLSSFILFVNKNDCIEIVTTCVPELFSVYQLYVASFWLFVHVDPVHQQLDISFFTGSSCFG